MQPDPQVVGVIRLQVAGFRTGRWVRDEYLAGANPELADRAGVSPLEWARRLKRDDLIALLQR